MGIDFCRPDNLSCSKEIEKCHKWVGKPHSHRSGKPKNKEKNITSQKKVQTQKKAEGLQDQKCVKKSHQTVKDFWESQNRKRVQDIVKNKNNVSTKEWKYKNKIRKHKDKGLLTIGTRNIVATVSPRDANGKLRKSLNAQRKQGLEEVKVEEKNRKQQYLQEARLKRKKSMKVLDTGAFEAAQEAVSQVLFKLPEEYDMANNENTRSLQQGMHRILAASNSSSILSQEEKQQKLIEVLRTAGVLTMATDDSNLEKISNLLCIKELNMNASSYMHSLDDMEKDTFVSMLCNLIIDRPTLKEIKFNYGALKESHVIQLASSLQKCTNLQEIHLDSNCFADKGLQALISVLLTHRETISTLSIQNLPTSCTFSTQVLEEFVGALEQCTAFVKLGFDLREFRHQEFKDRVARLLKKNSTRLRLERLKAKREKNEFKS